MKKKFYIIASLVGVITIFMAAMSDLSGKWVGKLVSTDGTEYPLSYNITLIGDSITGTAKSPHGEFPIEEGKLDTAGFHFKVTVNGLDIPHNGKFYGDSLGMDISLNGAGTHCTLLRVSN